MSLCARCGDPYNLRVGDDPTPECDRCAHDALSSARRTLRREAARLRKWFGSGANPSIGRLIARMEKAGRERAA